MVATGRGFAIVLLCGACTTDDLGDATDVGDACHEPLPVPEGGFQRSEVYVHVGSSACESGYCVVNHYRGDLIDSAVNGDGIPELDADEVIGPDDAAPCAEDCGWVGIRDRIHCTCKCGVTAGGDGNSITCDACPGGFECCPLLTTGEARGDYCVREGTCEGW